MTEQITGCFDTLFGRVGADNRKTVKEGRVLQLLAGFLDCCEKGSGDSFLYFNELSRECKGLPLLPILAGEFFDILVAAGINPAVDDCGGGDAGFYLDNMTALVNGTGKMMLRCLTEAPGRCLPQCRNVCGDLAICTREKLVNDIRLADRFAGGRCFVFADGKLTAVSPDSCKSTGKFYGFPGVRAILADHFADFTGNIANTPLLIHSLPGYGKTSMTISYALEKQENTVILASPETLQHDWAALISLLSGRSDRKFIIFFDDIEPENIDWYLFRTNVGGAFSLPSNILVVLASNYEFPASILSRGRAVTFPVFDELRCAEMIEDFLLDFGLKNPPQNLVMLLGADYTEAFGQKKFTELSPRTLMRHLSVFVRSQAKRRMLAEMADGEMITKPDPTLFYEFNINLMRTLYGDEYIARLREDKLRNLGK